MGRRRQSEVLIDARRRLLKARCYWYPIMLDLHRFMVAVARVTVNHDGRGGTAPDPLVWDQGGRRKVRRTDIRVTVDLASLPGPPGILGGPGFKFTGVVFLELILLPGLTVLAFSVNLLLFLGPYIGQWVLRIWVILEFLSWNFLSFSSNGLAAFGLGHSGAVREQPAAAPTHAPKQGVPTLRKG